MDTGTERRDPQRVGSRAVHRSSPAVVARYLAVDEQGNGLRATWRPAHGFVNLSLWRNDECVETFHLTPRDASELVGFLAGAFAASLPQPSRPSFRVVRSRDAPPGDAISMRRRVEDVSRRARVRLADGLEHLAGRVRSHRPT